MTLEVNVSEVIVVRDVFESVKQLFAKLIQWLAAKDEDDDDQDLTDEDGNKAPPAKPNNAVEESSPPDLGVQVTDNSNAGEAFGP